MGKKAAIILSMIILMSIFTPIMLIVTGILPNPFGERMDDIPQYSFDLCAEFYLTDRFDETPTVANLEGLTVKVYEVSDMSGSNRLYRETVTTAGSAGGRGRTAQTYPSGTKLLFIVNGAASYGNLSAIVEMPHYSQDYPPAYHYLSGVLAEGTFRLKYNPTLLPRAYTATGGSITLDAYPNSSDYDISTSGALTTLTLQIYNSQDDSGLMSWRDYEQAFIRDCVFVMYLPRYVYSTTAAVGQDGAMITASTLYLTEAKQPTSAQDGVYVAQLSDGCVDVDADQSSGLYFTRNTISVDVTFDFSSCGASANFTIEWTIWKNTDFLNWVSTGLDTSSDTEMFPHDSYKLNVVA